GSLPDRVVAHRHPRSVRSDADRLAGSLWRQVADPVSLDDNPQVDAGVGRRVDPVGAEIDEAIGAVDSVDDIVDNVALRVDAVGLAGCRGAAGVGDVIAPDDAAGAAGLNADKSALVEQVVLDEIVASSEHLDPHGEATDRAVPDREVQSAVGIDARRRRGSTAARPAYPKAVAVDRDVVGLDLDHVTGRGRSVQVLPQTPGALGGNGRRPRVD